MSDKKSALNVQEGGDHYKALKIQPIEYIHANGIPFPEGSVIKYVTRWRQKNGIADLRKARHFLDLLIELEERAPTNADRDEAAPVEPANAEDDVVVLAGPIDVLMRSRGEAPGAGWLGLSAHVMKFHDDRNSTRYAVRDGLGRFYAGSADGRAMWGPLSAAMEFDQKVLAEAVVNSLRAQEAKPT